MVKYNGKYLDVCKNGLNFCEYEEFKEILIGNIEAKYGEYCIKERVSEKFNKWKIMCLILLVFNMIFGIAFCIKKYTKSKKNAFI